MTPFTGLPHDNAPTHVTGESRFIDDYPLSIGELHLALHLSPHAHARILKIDTRAAAAMEGVRGVFTASDFHHNTWGTIFQDQPLLAGDSVNFAGEPIALVAAVDSQTARLAAAQIRVQYEVWEPILSIGEAKTKQSFIGEERGINRGDFDLAWKSAPHTLKGEIVIRGAEHFYLENQVGLSYPKEDGQIEVHSSTQHPSEVQHVVAHALGLNSKDVVCISPRMGGAFGGKESQSAPFGAYAALVSHRLKKAARIVLNKDEDMIVTGKRNPFENQYRVAFDTEGYILGLEVALFSDAGAYADLSTAIMERAMLHCDNAYYIPNVRISGRVCKTHFHPHTAFRGFGGPKGVATIEYVIEQIAHHLGIDALIVRKRNCYSDENGKNITPYGQVIENLCLPKLFAQLESDCDYQTRRQEISQFNQNSPNERKGLSMTAVKFGISFTTRFLNQGNALVNIYRDGSVQVSTGATEMGQGVNARIGQIVAEEFGLARDQVRIMPTSTDKNANTSPTAASSGTDLNGVAAVLAARKIKSRLSELAKRLMDIPESQWAKTTAALGSQDELILKEPTFDGRLPNEGADPSNHRADFFGVSFAEGVIRSIQNPKKTISFAELVNEAYLNRISLCDYSHYRIPNLSFNKLTGQGRAFLYFTQGTAASEVLINCLTGETKVLRVDILMDLGLPINEALDRGQIFGGFIQGMGWLTTENLFYAKSGMLLSHSPSTYKIPSVHDTPRIFNVALFPNPGNRVNLRGTKAVGEPPLLLGISVWTAIADALKGVPNKNQFPNLQIPATNEVILRNLFPQEFARWDK